VGEWPTRRDRREAARQVAKELVHSAALESNEKYHREFVWALIFCVIPFGWEEIMSGDQSLRVVIGWILWLVPLAIGIHAFWGWSSSTNKPRIVRVIIVGLLVSIFGCASSYSIWKSFRQTFLFVWPGLTLTDGRVQYYYAAERRPLINATVIVWDMGDPSNHINFQASEIDPRSGGFAESFLFIPKNVGHEQLDITTQSKDVDTSEELTVSTRGAHLLPAYRAIVKNRRGVVFECQSSDFPEKAALPDCGNNVFNH
jgi:hypothetical protein